MKSIRTKILSLILSLLLIVSVAGCSDSGGGGGGSGRPSGKKDGAQNLLSDAQGALADFKDVEDVEEKPGEFLENVMLATMAHVTARY